MSLKNKRNDRFEFSLSEANAMTKEVSQCKDCINRTGFDTCKVYGLKPAKYSSALAKVQCPERKL